MPTASYDDGLGTGKPDFMFDLIGSREFAREGRALDCRPASRCAASPDGYNLTHGFVWGIGGAFPSRSKFRSHRRNARRGVVRSGSALHRHRSRAAACRAEWDPDATRDLFGGFQFNADNGLYFGAGVSYTASYYLHRRDFATSEDSDFDRLGLQVRLGYHPGVRDLCAAGAAGSRRRADDAAGRRRTARRR